MVHILNVSIPYFPKSRNPLFLFVSFFFAESCKWCELLLSLGITAGAVCVYPNRVSNCLEHLKTVGGTNIPVASGNVLHVHVTYNCRVYRSQ